MPGIQNNKSTLDYLSTIGTTDRGDVLPLSETGKALVELAAFLIETATANLQRKGNIATGATASSMKIVNVDLNGPVKSLDVEILKTYDFLNSGVKGTNGGTGKYQFKTKFANRKMMLAILKWLKKRSAGGKTKYKAVSANERKNKKINKTVSQAKSRESLAYAVSVNIKKKGIKPTKFFTNAIRDTQKEAKKKLGAAIKFDIINSLN
jgi:hypothetical protein